MSKHSDYFGWKDTSERVAPQWHCDDTSWKKQVNFDVQKHLYWSDFSDQKSVQTPGEAFSDALLISRFQNFDWRIQKKSRLIQILRE